MHILFEERVTQRLLLIYKLQQHQKMHNSIHYTC